MSRLAWYNTLGIMSIGSAVINLIAMIIHIFNEDLKGFIMTSGLFTVALLALVYITKQRRKLLQDGPI